MNLGVKHSKVTASADVLPARFHGQLEADELALVCKVGARSDTATISIEDTDAGTLMAYAVIGRDEGGMVTIYAARSWLTGLGAVAIKGLFGASKVMGAPMRVHTERLQAYARILGADIALDAFDADGLSMGVFHG